MPERGISTFGLAILVGGGILLYSGAKGKSVSGVALEFLRGGNPVRASTINQSSGPSVGSSGSSSNVAPGQPTANKALMKFLAIPYGWSTGAQWEALDKLMMSESGYQNKIMNPSGAFGIGQALGHGTATSTAHNVTVIISGGGGTHVQDVNEYPSRLANAGDPGAQIIWTLAYIQERFGNPVNAWDFHVANNYY
jgi:hypothetical protein